MIVSSIAVLIPSDPQCVTDLFANSCNCTRWRGTELSVREACITFMTNHRHSRDTKVASAGSITIMELMFYEASSFDRARDAPWYKQ